MTLIDIEKLEYENFIFEDEYGDNSEMMEYISAEVLRNAPKIDPVNHAEWVIEPTVYKCAYPDEVSARTVCSNCGQLDTLDVFPLKAWEMGLKDIYRPKKTSNYCRNCGCKMDLRELYEQYKRDWCAARGYELIDTEIEECGINGECYACFDEWYSNEYLESRGE